MEIGAPKPPVCIAFCADAAFGTKITRQWLRSSALRLLQKLHEVAATCAPLAAALHVQKEWCRLPYAQMSSSLANAC